MPYTIATHVGTKIARQHNIRDKRITDKEAHIDPNGKHEVWLNCNLTEKEAYHKLFDSAVAEYNSRQKRNDRRISDYYEKIRNDKQKHTAYEMIVSVGNMEERIPEELSYEILTEFVEGWKEKNPNMYMFGCYYHADEQGVPHVHIDYIPVGTNYTRGMKKQVSSSKALEEMGYTLAKSFEEAFEIIKNDLGHHFDPVIGQIFIEHMDTFKGTAQVKWIHSENERLETICNNHGVEVYHPQTGKEHLEKDLYILENQAENLRAEISDIEEEKQNRIIHLQITNEKQMVMIVIRNYSSNSPHFEGGTPITSKNKKYHGYGIKSIKRIVRKYNGEVKFGYNNNFFVSRIIFPESLKQDE